MNTSRMIRTFAWIGSVLIVGAMATGCSFSTSQAPQDYLSDIDYVGQKSVKYIVRPDPMTKATSSGDSETKKLVDVKVEICDVSGDNKETNCGTSTLLNSVQRSSVDTGSEQTEESEGGLLLSAMMQDGGAVRMLDSVFWYDEKTLFVAYRETGASGGTAGSDTLTEPLVKRCRLQSDNSLLCNESEAVNNALFQQKTEKER